MCHFILLLSWPCCIGIATKCKRDVYCMGEKRTSPAARLSAEWRQIPVQFLRLTEIVVVSQASKLFWLPSTIHVTVASLGIFVHALSSVLAT